MKQKKKPVSKKLKNNNYLKPESSFASNKEVEVWYVEGFLVQDLNKVRSVIGEIQK